MQQDVPVRQESKVKVHNSQNSELRLDRGKNGCDLFRHVLRMILVYLPKKIQKSVFVSVDDLSCRTSRCFLIQSQLINKHRIGAAACDPKKRGTTKRDYRGFYYFRYGIR